MSQETRELDSVDPEFRKFDGCFIHYGSYACGYLKMFACGPQGSLDCDFNGCSC